MAKFCTKCGNRLEEGQVCNCQANINPQGNVVVASTNSNGFDFNETLNAYIDMVKGIFVKPVDTIKKYSTSGNFVLGLIAILLNSIISGIFLYCFCSEAMALLGSLMGMMMGGYGSLFGSSLVVEVPFMKTFLTGLGFMAVGFSVTALMIYVMAGVIFKDKTDIKKAFALVGVCSVFTTITTVVAIILNYVSTTFMLIVLLIAGVFYLTHLYQGITETTEVEKNKLAYVFVPAISVATFVVVYILPKIVF